MKQDIREKIEQIQQCVVPNGYKKTPIGICPIEWKVEYLENFGTFKNGINKDAEDFGFGSNLINLDDIFDQSILTNTHNFKSKVNASKNELLNYAIKKGDVIFVRSSVKPSGVGLTKVVMEDLIDTVFCGFLIKYTQKQNLLNYKYSKFVFYLDEFRKLLLRKSTIAANTNINQEALKKLVISIPAPVEQEKIAEILGEWEKAIELKTSLIDKLKTQKKALMQKLLQKDKELISIRECINKKYCRLVKPSELKRFEGKKIYLSTSSIIEDKIVSNEGYISFNDKPSRAQMIPLKNSVWFAKMKNSLKVYLASTEDSDKYILSTGFYGVLSDDKNLSSNYLKQILLSDLFNAKKDLYAEGSSQYAIKDDHLDLLDFYKPSFEEQEKIAKVLSMADEQMELHEKNLQQLEKQKKSLMQLLLTGIVRTV